MGNYFNSKPSNQDNIRLILYVPLLFSVLLLIDFFIIGKQFPILTLSIILSIFGVLIFYKFSWEIYIINLFLFLTTYHFYSGISINVGFKIYIPDFVIIGLFFNYILQRGYSIIKTKYFTALFILLNCYFLFAVVNGLFISHFEFDRVLGGARILALYSLFLPITYSLVNSEKRLKIIIKTILLSGITISIIGITRFILETPFRESLNSNDVPRYLGFFECPTLIFGICIILSVFFYFNKIPQKMLFSILICVFIFGIIISNYRTTWAGLIISSVFIITFSLNRKKLQKMFLRLSFFSVLGIFFIGLIIKFTSIGNYILDKFSYQNILDGIFWRYFSWYHAWTVITSHPLFGTGFGYKHIFYGFTLDFTSIAQYDKNQIHNDYLWILVIGGITCGFLFALLFFEINLIALKNMKNNNSTVYKAIYISVIATILSLLIFAFTQPVFSEKYTVMIYFVLGLILSLTKIFPNKEQINQNFQKQNEMIL